MTTYLLTLIKTVTIQIIGVFGIFFLLGFILSKFQEWNHKNYHRTVGWKGILWTAWIGTPIHEIGHVFFAKIFRHKIQNITIFQPNELNGNLGHVNHSYKKHSLYQKMGNFFIGAAPMIFGSMFLVIMLYFLVPNGKEILLPLTQTDLTLVSFLTSIKQTLLNLFSPENIKAWNFWLFLYISFCISSHLAPSKQDQKGMWRGFFWITILLILINMITLGVGVNITKYVLGTIHYLQIFITIFIYAGIISFLHLLLSTIILLPIKKFKNSR